MHRANWLMFFFSLLLPAAALADEASIAAANSYSSNLLPESSLAYRLNALDASSWQLPPTVELSQYSNRATDVIADLQFRDPGAFARVSKVRELSLLTLAELGESRLFFGVNYAGLFGFHLGARPRLGDERCVELARMPYLNSATRGNIAR